ncbi:hypothetical protein GSI_13596 [Ganoderma sinense ZZ0214-1]|uniref:Uncharacterized protein n=1 Tax=Ganoderma sinense ZZ0214-1 TaxID=1077348 RepID=A0A2G8RQQ3_9APHY|nr:hypothetical protein GSI_13596 [Ganoderma sinense ZZ0214-1]
MPNGCAAKKKMTQGSIRSPPRNRPISWKRPEARNVPNSIPRSPAIHHPGYPPKTRNVCRSAWCHRFDQNSCNEPNRHGSSWNGGHEVGEWSRMPTPIKEAMSYHISIPRMMTRPAKM